MATQTQTNGKKNGNGKAKAAPPPNGKAKGSPLEGPPVPRVTSTKQTSIPGTDEPAKVTKRVSAAAEALRTKFNAEKRAKQETKKARGHLEMLMEEDGVPRLEIVDDEGQTVEIWVDVSKKIKMRIVDEEN